MDDRTFTRLLRRTQKKNSASLTLDHGSRVAVIGGGPAGSFFSYFLLDMIERIGLKIHVDIYEPRDFDVPGPAGCNMCGGVIYESLVQNLAVEGINLPPTIVQRGIVCNMLHLDIGSAQIQTPRHEKRIATTFRGTGPRGLMEFKGASLDGYLMRTAVAKGARHICGRVAEVRWLTDAYTAAPGDKLVQIKTQGGVFQTYELLAVTSGVNTAVLKLFRDLDFGYEPPQTTKLLVREYRLGEEVVSKYVGPIFHAFLLDIPGLDYGAIIPKGDYVTACLLSSHGNLGTNTMDTFLNEPAVRSVLPPNFSSLQSACHCGPRINIAGSAQPFGDRIVFIGDSGVSRLYKDGLGAAYRASKIAATTAVFQGISSSDFKKHYLPFCRRLEFDNRIGKFLFRIVGQIQKMRFARRAVLHMVSTEQKGKAMAERGMSALMWDMLTGGAPYGEVLRHALHPSFWTRLLWNALVSLISPDGNEPAAHKPVPAISQDAPDSQAREVNTMSLGALGQDYQDGEIIVRQGELGDCMYVVQEGHVEVLIESENHQVQLSILGKHEFFGEMAIFDHEIRSATIRALGPARILTVDHKNLLRRIHEDPSLAYHLLQVMSNRVRRLSGEVAELKRYPDQAVPVSQTTSGNKV
ncbi:MAG TPA: cyclic nucleotide-binding domain-containing protein [Anaerolineales bacterium]|nr:cyclic nucleotide-binding domain-containing protein [Anaerolineales bacterium]